MNFERINEGLDVAPLMAWLDANPEWWSTITMRQDYLGSAHYATQCIYARGPREFSFEAYFCELAALDYPVLPVMIDVLMPVLRPMLQALAFTELGRILIVRLPAGASLDEHTDEGAYAEHFARFHIALSTNPGCELVVDGQPQHMAAGEAWWFNHSKPHFARNAGTTDRVHLIVDAVSPRFEGSHHGPGARHPGAGHAGPVAAHA